MTYAYKAVRMTQGQRHMLKSIALSSNGRAYFGQDRTAHSLARKRLAELYWPPHGRWQRWRLTPDGEREARRLGYLPSI